MLRSFTVLGDTPMIPRPKFPLKSMAYAARNVGLLLLAAAPALGAPVLNGSYTGDLGEVQFDTEPDGRVSGKYQKAGACPFDPDRAVVLGQFQGNVLAGTVTLCQVGTACMAERTYPFLAFYNPREGTLSADVKLDTGCNSPALKGNRLLLIKGAHEDAPSASADPSQKRRGNPKRNAELAKRAFELGVKAMEAQDYEGAKSHFEVSLSFDDRNYLGYYGVGVAESKLGHTQRALDSLGRAAELRGDYPDTYYNLACVHARLGDRKNTLSNLNKAVRYGFDEPEIMSGDRDLGKLLSGDPEFLSIVAKASDQKGRHSRGARRAEGKR